MGIEVRGAHASNTAMRRAADFVEGTKKSKVGQPPKRTPTHHSKFLQDIAASATGRGLL